MTLVRISACKYRFFLCALHVYPLVTFCMMTDKYLCPCEFWWEGSAYFGFGWESRQADPIVSKQTGYGWIGGTNFGEKITLIYRYPVVHVYPMGGSHVTPYTLFFCISNQSTLWYLWAFSEPHMSPYRLLLFFNHWNVWQSQMTLYSHVCEKLERRYKVSEIAEWFAYCSLEVRLIILPYFSG